MMIDLFLFSFFDSFMCLGAYLVMKMWFKEREEWYWNPIYMCPTCMASVWGGGIYLYFYGFHYQMFAVMLAVAFLNSFFIKLYWKIYE